MVSPRLKYSRRARMVIRAVAMATAQVGVKRTTAMTTGMRTKAVRTRVPGMGEEDSRYQLSDRRKRELAFGVERPATERQKEVSGNRGGEEFERITQRYTERG